MFCLVFNFVMFVIDVIDDHIVCDHIVYTCSRIVFVWALYVVGYASLCLAHKERVLNMDLLCYVHWLPCCHVLFVEGRR